MTKDRRRVRLPIAPAIDGRRSAAGSYFIKRAGSAVSSRTRSVDNPGRRKSGPGFVPQIAKAQEANFALRDREKTQCDGMTPFAGWRACYRTGGPVNFG
jgi:hypothetical protein